MAAIVQLHPIQPAPFLPLGPVYSGAPRLSVRPAPVAQRALSVGHGLPPNGHSRAPAHSAAHAHSPLHEPAAVLCNFDAAALARVADDLGVRREPGFYACAWDAAVGWLDTLLERLVNVHGWELHGNAVTCGPNVIVLEAFDTMFPLSHPRAATPGPAPGSTVYVVHGAWRVSADALAALPPLADLLAFAQCLRPHVLLVRGRGLPDRHWLLQHEHVVRDILGDVHFRRLLDGLGEHCARIAATSHGDRAVPTMHHMEMFARTQDRPTAGPSRLGPRWSDANQTQRPSPPQTPGGSSSSAYAHTSHPSYGSSLSHAYEHARYGSASSRPSPPTSPTPFVQAIHDFDPTIMAASASRAHDQYLAFRAGEVLRVHVRDPTGWWDGELTAPASERRARRGWFPSNYVRDLDDLQAAAGGGGGDAMRRARSSPASAGMCSPTGPPCSVGLDLHGRQMSAVSAHSRASTSTSSYAAPASSGGGRGGGGDSPASPAPLSSAFQATLQPVVQSLALLQSSIHARRAHIQPSTALVISAIRTALLQMDCLAKDSPTLAAHPVLARERRYVLAELSKLVACAKLAGADDAGAEPAPSGADDAATLDATAKAARSVFASVKRFMHLADGCGVEVQPVPGNADDPASASTPLSAATSATPPAPPVTHDPLRVRIPGGNTGNARIQDTFRLRAASIGDLRAARHAASRTSPPPPPLPTSHPGLRDASGSGTPVSATFSTASGRSSPASTHSCTRTLDDLSTPTTAEAVAVPQPPNLATAAAIHDAIALAEDSLLSIIASFIGHIHSHQIDSHPSSHAYLIELTRETVDRVRDLLTIVEAVGRHATATAAGLAQAQVQAQHPHPPSKGVGELKVARDGLYDAASRLVEAAEVVANAPFAATDGYDGEKARLLQVATTTLRAGTECARVVRLCVPEHGVPPEPVPPAPASAPASASASASTLRTHPVGERGAHTLSSLHRKATSLSQLQRRYEQDGPGLSEDAEELVSDEDATVRVPRPASRPPLLHVHSSPGLSLAMRSVSDMGPAPALAPGTRSRSSSLTSPAPPPRIQHRSPSRSADLDKFTADYAIRIPSPATSAASRLSSLSVTSSAQSTRPTVFSALSKKDLRGQYADANADVSSARLDAPFERPPQRPMPTRPPPPPPVAAGVATVRPAMPARSATLPIPPLVGATLPSPTFTGMGPGVAVGSSFRLMTHDYDPRDVAFNSDGALVGATLRVLVEKMTPHDGPVDPTFWATFFFTFRLHTSPVDLVRAVAERYDAPAPPGANAQTWAERRVVPVRLRIYNFLKAWLDTHWRADTDDAALPALEAFATDAARTLPGMGPRLLEAVRRRAAPAEAAPGAGSSASAGMKKSSSMDRIKGSAQAGLTHAHTAGAGGAGAFPTPIMSKQLHAALLRHPAGVGVAEFDSLELARQLTLMESRLFQAVAPEDLLMTGKKPVPQLKRLSTVSNQITGWVADGILNETDAKRRAALLKFYIKLAEKCLSLNNFSSLFAVVAGLNSSTILRLKKTWDALSSKYRVLMDRLRAIIDVTRNHATYRARMREVTGPCLPFLGLILSDITFTHDGNPSTRPSTLAPDRALINLDKYAKLGRIAIEFRRYQTPFDLKELEPVQAFLEHALTERGSGSLDALYRKSLMLEPRQGSEQLSSALEKPHWLGGRMNLI
ncbi:Ras guanine nucleotide exchange factor bud5 [Cryptotrichosporon argae]